MDLQEYRGCLEKLSFGKRLPGALYVARDVVSDFGPELNHLLAQLAVVFEVGPEFNLIKFRTGELKVSFLSYPDFMEDPHPALRHAVTIDLASGKARHTDYGDNINPPILHRKELLVAREHPRWQEFRALTLAEEDAGLYEEAGVIGFRLNWERLLSNRGLRIDGHQLCAIESNWVQNPLEGDAASGSGWLVVDRHKTALRRYDLSRPVKSLLEHGMLKPDSTLFDYGCGQGGDVTGLKGLGYTAEGWDPVFRPGVAKAQADVVNLGYVLNVIEDPVERLEALHGAWKLTHRILVVSTLIARSLDLESTRLLADGVLTARNTFQKYFEQHELRQFIEDALEVTAVPVALGIFYVFRDPAEQQDFLSSRSRRVIDWSQISARLGLGAPPKTRWKVLYEENQELLDLFGNLALRLGRFPQASEFGREAEVVEKLGTVKRALRAYVLGGGAEGLDWSQVAERFGIGQPPKTRWEDLYEQNQQLLDSFWDRTLQLGRLPAPEEFPRTGDLAKGVGSPKKLLRLFLRRGGGAALKQAAQSRRKDLLVYVALANLRKRVPFGHLSTGLRLDVKEFFGSYTDALAKGLELLYAAGDAGEIEPACERVTVGWQDEQALYFHHSVLPLLPPILRVYCGCAETLCGDLGRVDLIKLHKASGKLTFLIYDDVENQFLPELRLRIKVNLRSAFVQVFDHSMDHQVLCFKERFFAPDHRRYSEWVEFGRKLRAAGVTDARFIGPSRSELDALLARTAADENQP